MNYFYVQDKWIFGQNRGGCFEFSKEKYDEYIELISDQFPNVVTEAQNDNRFVHIASSSDGVHNVLVECNDDLQEGQIRYYK